MISAGPLTTIDVSATATTVSASVAVLSPSFGSVTPAATDTVAEFSTVPRASLWTSACAVITTALPAPGSTLISVSTSPVCVPPAAQDEVPDATHCHCTLANSAGSN